MKNLLRPSRLARFGDFEVDLEAGELQSEEYKQRADRR